MLSLVVNIEAIVPGFSVRIPPRIFLSCTHLMALDVMYRSESCQKIRRMRGDVKDPWRLQEEGGRTGQENLGRATLKAPKRLQSASR